MPTYKSSPVSATPLCPSSQPGPDLPPAPAGDLCRALSWTSRATWDMVSDQLDLTLTGVQRRMIDERAVTDVAMTIVRRMSPGEANVVLFTQGQEAETGADFELLVIDGGSYAAYLVQAKAMKADGDKEGYPALGERDGGVMQFDKLLAACGPTGAWAGHGALHIFYNGELLKTGGTWPNDRCLHASGLDEAARGITVAPTADIAAAVDAGRRSYRYDRIAPECWPWWCFFCCNRIGLGDLVQRSAGRRRSDPPADIVGNDYGPRPPVIRQVADAPQYVSAARSQEGRRRLIELPDDASSPAASTIVVLEFRSDATQD